MSTSSNPGSSTVNTIPSATPDEQHSGALVPVGNYPLTPYAGSLWQGGPTPRPEMLSAGPDPMSLLRAFNRRWPLATGLGILAAMVAMAAAWFLIPQKGEVVAYVKVARSTESMTRDPRQVDSNEFITLQRTTMEYMKSKSLLTRALRDSSISQLPLVKKQADPVEWLQDELTLKFPGEAEILMITMSGEEIDQIVKIVDAVVDAYFNEVVEKAVQDRGKKEERLKQLEKEKSEMLVRELKEVQRMSEALGIVDPNAAATQNQMLQVHLTTLNNSIFGLRGQLSSLDVEIERCIIDIQLAQDSTAKEARAEEEIHKDEKLKKLEDKLSDLEMGIEEAQNTFKGKGKENPTVQRLLKEKATLEDKIIARRDDLLKKFSDSTELVKVKEFEGKKRAFEKHRDSLKEQLARQEEAEAETRDKLKVISRDTADLESRRQKIKTLEQVAAKLNDELQTIGLEKYAPVRIERVEQAIPPGSLPVVRKAGLVVFSGFATFFFVGLAVAFVEFQARRISSSTELVDGLGMRVVGALPSIARPGRKALAAANGDLNRLLVESIDTIRTNLIHCAVSQPTRVVMITSALDREGKTTVASQLAASLARCGRRALLVDGDLRRPTAHRLFELPLEPGLCEVLRGEVEVDDVIRPTRVAGLWMISAGQYDLESIQALSRDGVGDVFDVLRARFDFVVVDSAPVLSIADASMMGQHVDAAILCVMREVSQAAKVYEASEQLRSVGVHVLGTVINGERTEATYRAYAARAS